MQTEDRDEIVNTTMYFYFWVPYNAGGGDFLTSWETRSFSLTSIHGIILFNVLFNDAVNCQPLASVICGWVWSEMCVARMGQMINTNFCLGKIENHLIGWGVRWQGNGSWRNMVGAMEWIRLAYCKNRWRALENIVMNLWLCWQEVRSVQRFWVLETLKLR